MSERRKGLAVALIFAITLATGLAVVRSVGARDSNLTHLDRVNNIAGTNIGPEQGWLAVGMNGDGATFAVVAADPFGRGPGETLRQPSFRYSRLGYPYLSAVLVFGQQELVLIGLGVVGALAVAGAAFISERLSHERGWMAWLIVANPALVVGFLGNTAEPLSIFLLSVALFTGSRLAAIAVALVRPSYIVGLANHWRLLLFGLVSALAIKAFWSWWFDEAFLSGTSNFDIPFRGVIESPSVLGWIVVLAGLATAVVGAKQRDWGWILSGMMVISLAMVVVDTPINALRAAGMLPVLWAFGPKYESSAARVPQG